MTKISLLAALLLVVAGRHEAIAQDRPGAGKAAPTASAAEQEVLRAERAYLDARVRNDTAALRRVLADEFVATGSGGQVGDKAGALRSANVTPGGDTIRAMATNDVRVRVYGMTAVVTGRRSQQTPRGEAHLRFTHVFVRRQGRWQLAASQVGSVGEAADSALRPLA